MCIVQLKEKGEKDSQLWRDFMFEIFMFIWLVVRLVTRPSSSVLQSIKTDSSQAQPELDAPTFRNFSKQFLNIPYLVN